MLWWDIRKLVEPVETLKLEYAGYMPGQKLGGIVMEYESTMVRCYGYSLYKINTLNSMSTQPIKISCFFLWPKICSLSMSMLNLLTDDFVSLADQVHGGYRARSDPTLQ